MRRVDDKAYNKATKIILMIALSLVLVLILILLYAYCVSAGVISPFLQATDVDAMNTPTVNPTVEITPDPTNTPIPTPSPTVEIKENDVINIAVFGMDNRYKRTIVGGRSDVNMILTIDKTDQSIRITSFMRDLLVYLPSKSDYNRINAAIVYEEDGPAGAAKVLENEFGIQIDHYIVTSFVGMAKIIDTIGGVDLYLTQNNIWEMNGLIQEMNPLHYNSYNSYLLNKTGNVHVNGIQAVAYARIRHVDGGFARDSKQKEVLLAAKNQLMDISLSQLNQLLEDVQNYVEMDMDFFEFVEVATNLYKMRDADVQTLRIPMDGHYEETRYQGMSILDYDREYTQDALYDFIYFNETP